MLLCTLANILCPDESECLDLLSLIIWFYFDDTKLGLFCAASVWMCFGGSGDDDGGDELGSDESKNFVSDTRNPLLSSTV